MEQWNELFSSSSDDFKPLSVDHAKPGRLKVVGDEVNVSLPVVQVGYWSYVHLCYVYDKLLTVRFCGSFWLKAIIYVDGRCPIATFKRVDDTKVIVNIRGVHMQIVLCEKTDVHLKFMCVCTEYRTASSVIIQASLSPRSVTSKLVSVPDPPIKCSWDIFLFHCLFLSLVWCWYVT